LVQLYDRERDEQEYDIMRKNKNEGTSSKYNSQKGNHYKDEVRKEDSYKQTQLQTTSKNPTVNNYANSSANYKDNQNSQQSELILPVIKSANNSNKLSPLIRKKIANYGVVKGSNFTLDKSVNIDDEYFKINKELELSVNKYNSNLEKLKIDDFLARKKLQDELLYKINFKMDKLKNGLNDKFYFQDNLYKEWYKELKLNQHNG
jgi:hypothetical protein